MYPRQIRLKTDNFRASCRALGNVVAALSMLVAGACLSRSAAALEKYATVPLPDFGQGSRATAVARAANGDYAVVGAVRNPDGQRSDAFLWAVTGGDFNGDTIPDIVATGLPKPPGTSAEAAGVVFLEGDPDQPIIVGRILGTDIPGTQAVLWTRNSMGQFSNTILDDAASEATGVVTGDTPLGLIIVVCGKYLLPNGDWHACLWLLGPQGRKRTDLGTLGGRNSEAKALGFIDNILFDRIGVVGSAQRADGRRVATFYAVTLTDHENELRWNATALPMPSGAQSQANAFTHTSSIMIYGDTATHIVGDVTGSNGRTLAVLWTLVPDGTSNTILFKEIGSPDGYRNSTARGIVFNGLGGADAITVGASQGVTVGAAWNSANDRVGMGALTHNAVVDDPFFFDALRRTEAVGKNESITVSLNAVGPGGAIAGEGLPSGASAPQAMLFLPTNRDVPNIIAVLIGQVWGDPHVDDAWAQDGRGPRFVPDKEDKKPKVAIELGFLPLSPPSDHRTPLHLAFGGKITPRSPNSHGIWNVTTQVYSTTFGVWITVGQIIASDEYFQRAIEIPNPEQLMLASDEMLRVRLIVTPLTGDAGRDWFFMLDYMEQDNVYLP